ncbi:MAG: uroporphyrinogen decarboxylase family protein [Anaerolineales bacterium]|jgi:uroporphyrinogen decarboxylase
MMNSCDRIRKTIAHTPADRPPADGSFSPKVWQALRAHFKINDDEEVLIALGIDFRQAVLEPSNEFAAKAVPAPVPAEGVGVGLKNLVHILPNGEFEDDRGIRRMVGSTGEYFRFTHHPLSDADRPEAYTFPDLDLPERYDHIRRQVQKFKDKYMIEIETGNIFRDAWELRGFDAFLMDTHLNPDFVSRLLDIITEVKISEVTRLIKAGVDIVQLVGDVASEQSMLISPRWWRAEIKPRLAQVIAATRRPGIYYYFHSDGAMQAVLPDLIEIGFDIVNPMQPECMDVNAIKRQYGAQFTMHSTLSSQHTLPFGTQLDVREEVRARIRDCGSDGGLVLAPSNSVQSDVPLDNLLAVYDEIKTPRL